MSIFKKGELVTIVRSWDDKGTYYFQHATVYSAGKKQMVLTDETGKELGRHFSPVPDDAADVASVSRSGVFRRMADEAAEALCLKLGAALVEVKRANHEGILARAKHESVGYLNAIRKDIELLHEPRAIKR